MAPRAPSSRPSASKPASTSQYWSRSWIDDRKCSRRSSIHFTGRLQQQAGRRDRDLLGIENELGAEAAADVGGHHADAVLVEAEHLHDEEAGFVGELGRAPHRQHVGCRVETRDQAAGFDRVRAAAVLLEVDRQPVRRSRNGRIGVAIALDEIDQQVALAVDMHVGRAGSRARRGSPMPRAVPRCRFRSAPARPRRYSACRRRPARSLRRRRRPPCPPG